MPWEDVKPREKSRDLAWNAPASISCREAGKSGNQSIVLTLRDGPDWFVPGARVAIRLGTKEDAGKLAIEPDGRHLVEASRPSAKEPDPGKRARVVFPLFDSVKINRSEREPVEIKVEQYRVLVTLPAWARRKDAGPVVVSSSTGSATKVPFRMGTSDSRLTGTR